MSGRGAIALYLLVYMFFYGVVFAMRYDQRDKEPKDFGWKFFDLDNVETWELDEPRLFLTDQNEVFIGRIIEKDLIDYKVYTETPHHGIAQFWQPIPLTK